MFYLKKILQSHGVPFTGLLIFFLVDPFQLGFLAGYLLSVILVLNVNELKKLMDFDFFLLLVYSLVFTIFYSINMAAGVQFVFIYLLFPSCFYLIGKKLLFKTDSHLEIFFLFFSLSVVFSFSALASVILNLIEGGFIQTNRTIPMFWNGKKMKATAMGAYLTYNMTIPSLLLNYQQKIRKVFMLFAASIFMLTLLSVFRLGSRTQLVITFASFVIALFFIISNQNKKNNFKLISSLVILIGGVLFFFPIDLDADYFSVLGSRLQDSGNASSAGGRTGRWAKSMTYIFSDPLGWDIEAFGYSHNMWLDVARYTGVISFILLVLVTIRFYLKTLKAIRLNKEALLLNSQILVYSFASFLLFFVEPIMEGLFFLFVSFCMFQGIINAYIEKYSICN